MEFNPQGKTYSIYRNFDHILSVCLKQRPSYNLKRTELTLSLRRRRTMMCQIKTHYKAFP